MPKRQKGLRRQRQVNADRNFGAKIVDCLQPELSVVSSKQCSSRNGKLTTWTSTGRPVPASSTARLMYE
uniref:Uncharacterized protein n=1 Tax=Romanomermis culicivorax TaxID=13658 RepID=A0A915JWN8_ROMCU